MADKLLLNNITTSNIPLESVDEAAWNMGESLPPPYEHPRIDFHSGWRDRGFAIAFWIQGIIVIIVGLVFGIWFLISAPQYNIFHMKTSTIFGFNIDLVVYSMVAAAVIGVIVSFMTFFLLEKCANLIIIGSFIIIIAVEVALCVFLLCMAHGNAVIIPSIALFITLIFVWYVRKRISFTGSHLQVGCSVLRSHPSLIWVAIVMSVLEFLWLVFWSLSVIGIIYVWFRPMSDSHTDQKEFTSANYSRYLVNQQPVQRVRSDARSHETNLSAYLLGVILIFVLLILAYWGTIVFGNIAHFINACTVGHWWFPAGTTQQYAMKTSAKRAFTTNFGTICFGSFVEAVLKALGSSTNEEGGGGGGAKCAWCILKLLEQLIGYMNEWGFIFAALTGQSFLEASKSFIRLFRTRGWTMVINDTIVGYCLGIVNIFVGFASAGAGGLIVYFFDRDPSSHAARNIIYVSYISFLIGILVNSLMTMVLSSCVRAVFVCFALNPAALGATHPDHLQRLTKVWHRAYPKEYAASDYNQYLPKPTYEDNI